ncbi:hypothetical protein [Erythrobacter sp. A6_0]|uniref:hypothetical protein n=1 Tax=Erythrobacter sp. A6_0 TaxID=2821089 RepID=UPI001ADCD183|nr:hypothetical protein [Erythrobacter sp. A6_0]MBO9511321.1 hypothetical protein [Erythrobacter sp. A6_0]
MIAARAASLLGAFALAACATVQPTGSPVTLTLAGASIPADRTNQAFLYRVPSATDHESMVTQEWSMLGREDRAALTGFWEYRAKACIPARPAVSGMDDAIAEIVRQAADTRVVIVNESHTVTRHRDTVARLLSALRPLGFTVYAAETFSNSEDEVDPIDAHPELRWAAAKDGYYSREPAFGRTIGLARSLGCRLVAYEETESQSAGRDADMTESIRARETAQAANLAQILATMAPEEKLIVHVGYSHASEVPLPNGDGSENLWMAARLKALTGIDPLTVSQTLCRSDGGLPFLAELPQDEPAGLVDLVLSQPVARFERGRPMWRREVGDAEVNLPPELRNRAGPLIVEAFRAGDPFSAVPMDRVYLEPGEDIPLLLPPGDYTVRAIIPASGTK